MWEKLSLGFILSYFILDYFKIGSSNKIQRFNNGRSLGLLERWYTAHHDRGHRNICYILQFNGNPPTIGDIIQTMVNLSKKHNILNCKTIPTKNNSEEEKEIMFYDINDYNIGLNHPWLSSIKSIERKDDSTVNELVTKLINSNYKHNKPPWKIHLISSTLESNNTPFEIILSVNHLITDGIGGMILCNEFIQMLLQVQGIKQSNTLNIQFDKSYALDEVLDIRPTLIPVLLKLTNTYIIQRLPFIHKFKKKPFIPMSKDTRCLSTGTPSFGCLTEEQTKILIDLCHKEHISFHGLLCGISHAVFTYFEHCYNPLTLNNKYYTHNIGTPINLRRFSSLQDNALGVFITKINHKRTFQYNNTILYLSNVAMTQIYRDIPSSIPLIGMLKYVPNLKNYLNMELNKYPGGRDSTITLSNIGVHNINIDECNNNIPWRLNKVHFTQQHHLGNGSSFMASILTCNNKLTYSIVSCQPVIPVQLNSFVSDLYTQIFLLIIEKQTLNITIHDICKNLTIELPNISN